MEENRYTEIVDSGSDGDDDKKDLSQPEGEKPVAFDASKLANRDGVRQMDREVIICNDLSQIQDLFQKHNIMKGIKPLDKQKEDLAKEEPAKDKEAKIYPIPNHMFEGFAEIDHTNEDEFSFLVNTLVIQYLEMVLLKVDETSEDPAVRYASTNWDYALEFPDNLATMGRSELHDIANYYDLAHHSRGNRDKKKLRHVLMYPKTLFTDKQEIERNRLLREREKIRSKYAEKENLPGLIPDHPKTFTEMCIKEIHEERYGKNKVVAPKSDDEVNLKYITTNMLDQELIGKAPDPAKIEKLIAAKKEDLKRLEANMIKKEKRAKEDYERMQKEMKEDEARPKREDDSSDDERKPVEKEWKDKT